MIQFQNEYLTIFESALFRTTSTLIQTKDCILLVDPTWLPQEIKTIQLHIETIQNNRPLYLLFTHSDYDHIIAWKAFPEAKVIVSKAFIKNPSKEKIIQQIIDFDHSYYIQRDYPILYPEGDLIVQNDGQKLTIGDTTLQFYFAPGHNMDGMFTIIQPLGIFIAGDYLSNIEFPYIYHSSTEYEKTLHKVNYIFANQRIRMLIPGHGDHTTNFREIEKRKKENELYIHQLRTAIQNNRIYPEHTLWERYDFERGMKSFHEGNVKLIKTELGIEA